MTDEEKNDTMQNLQKISHEFEQILRRMQADDQKLEHVHRCWSEYDRAVQLSLPWLIEAERLLKEGGIKQCKVSRLIAFIILHSYSVGNGNTKVAGPPPTGKVDRVGWISN